MIRFLCLGIWLFLSASVTAQDLEPRRWSHLPTGINVFSLAGSVASGDISFDPVLEIEDASFDVWGGGLFYMRSFAVLGKSARLDILAPYASGRWQGLLQGEPASVRRQGFLDPRLRLSVLLYGAPAESPAEFAVSEKSNTVVGAAISVTLPWGEYFPDKLINLGANRWMIRPQLGVTHTRGKWTGELTGSVFLFGKNDNFRSGNTLEADPLWAVQAHLIYTFRPGLWTSFSTGYGDGAEISINGVRGAVRSEKWLTSLAVGIPINRQQGIKLAWISDRSQNRFGSDSDSLTVAWSLVY